MCYTVIRQRRCILFLWPFCVVEISLSDIQRQMQVAYYSVLQRVRFGWWCFENPSNKMLMLSTARGPFWSYPAPTTGFGRRDALTAPLREVASVWSLSFLQPSSTGPTFFRDTGLYLSRVIAFESKSLHGCWNHADTTWRYCCYVGARRSWTTGTVKKEPLEERLSRNRRQRWWFGAMLLLFYCLYPLSRNRRKWRRLTVSPYGNAQRWLSTLGVLTFGRAIGSTMAMK